jgi:hypothetical protein
VEAAQIAPASTEYLRLARRAKLLSWASLAYMTVEGIVAIVAGVVAGSIVLIGFGIDSAIEGFASVVIVWRLGSENSCVCGFRSPSLIAPAVLLLLSLKMFWPSPMFDSWMKPSYQ